MNFVLLAPLSLVALAALALPLLIHLVRRLQLVETEFAALRWVVERVQPRQRLRFERPWLLLLRLALLAFLALLLARPVLESPAAPRAAWILVVPGADLAAAQRALATTVGEWRWLAPGFPRVDAGTVEAGAVNSSASVSSLLREFDAQWPGDAVLHVAVPQQLAGLDGERARLAHAIDWQVVPGQMREDMPASAHATMKIAVRYADDQQDALIYLRAAIAAWNEREPGHYVLDAQASTQALPDDADALVWLAPQVPAAVDAWIEHGGIALLAPHAGDDEGDVLWRDHDGRVLARRSSVGSGNVIGVAGAFAPANVPMLLDADFPDRLLSALRAPPTPPTRAPAQAMQPRRESAAVSTSTATPESRRAIDAWLALLIGALFVLERIVATRRRAERDA